MKSANVLSATRSSRMRIVDFLKKDCVCLELKSKDKDGVIGEMLSLLEGHPAVPDVEAFGRAVMEREAQASTGVGHGVAIPHARTETVNDFVAVVARSTDGVDFDSIDGKPVHVFVLMGVPQKKVHSYMKMLAHLSHLFKRQELVGNIMNAADAATVIELLRLNER